ncbi:hypothetical protein Aperf_G00000122443 [Anoplocephala perfoliata]
MRSVHIRHSNDPNYIPPFHLSIHPSIHPSEVPIGQFGRSFLHIKERPKIDYQYEECQEQTNTLNYMKELDKEQRMGEKSAGDGEPDQGYTSNWDLGYDVRNGKEEIGEQNWQAGGERETPQNEALIGGVARCGGQRTSANVDIMSGEALLPIKRSGRLDMQYLGSNMVAVMVTRWRKPRPDLPGRSN